MDFSIIIAHRGDPLGLWATVHSCDIELAGSGYEYEYRIVSNGSGMEKDYELGKQISFIEQFKKLGSFEHFAAPMSAPAARQRATVGAKGKILFFFDNHCLVDKGYFKRALLNMEAHSMDMLHSTTKFYSAELKHYHYSLKLSFNFWAESAPVPVHPFKPYRIAAAGHGGFAVRRDVWEEVSGYGPEELFTGYAGEEIYFDLKMAMLDKSNWIDPKLVHYHYAGTRGYARHHSDDYYRNLMTCAFVIGGEKWLNKVYSSFSKHPKMESTKTMYELFEEAYERGTTHAAHMASIRHRTLDEQLEKFSAEQIATN